MNRFQLILTLVALLLPFAVNMLVDSQAKAVWHPPHSDNPDIDIIRHFYGDGQ